MLPYYAIVHVYLFYDGDVDMKIMSPSGKKSVSISDAQVTFMACGTLVRTNVCYYKFMINWQMILHGKGRCRGLYQINTIIFTVQTEWKKSELILSTFTLEIRNILRYFIDQNCLRNKIQQQITNLRLCVTFPYYFFLRFITTVL